MPRRFSLKLWAPLATTSRISKEDYTGTPHPPCANAVSFHEIQLYTSRFSSSPMLSRAPPLSRFPQLYWSCRYTQHTMFNGRTPIKISTASVSGPLPVTVPAVGTARTAHQRSRYYYPTSPSSSPPGTDQKTSLSTH